MTRMVRVYFLSYQGRLTSHNTHSKDNRKGRKKYRYLEYHLVDVDYQPNFANYNDMSLIKMFPHINYNMESRLSNRAQLFLE